MRTRGVMRALKEAVESRFPFAFIFLQRLRYRASTYDSGPVPVSPKTEIVIEGFPRCGNTFALEAFRFLQKKPVGIAHHLHSHAQVAVARRYGIPSLIVFRDPVDCVASYSVRDISVDYRWAFNRYVVFYDRLLAEDDGVFFVSFQRVVGDFGGVIDGVNRRFGTNFDNRYLSEEDVRVVFEMIERRHAIRNFGQINESMIARPSSTRGGSKRASILNWARTMEPELMERANRVHERLMQRVES